ncbi:MAG: DNA gyrase inhibitor YacG [Methyloceanibacter sp.]|nr:DNA gyrase inhibitor YacG [Methyloceanibacter sp.]
MAYQVGGRDRVNAPSRSAPSEPSRKRTKGSVRKAGARCPICDKPAAHDYRPFCSKRCADLDLGHWLGGRYAVPGERFVPNDAEQDE